MNVQKESSKMVTPSVSTPKTKLKLSFMDQIQPPVYIGIIFYYRDNGTDIHERLVKLEKSLSETLVLFYPFAGRYLEESGCSFIDCEDQGVEYVVAKVDGNIDDLLLDNNEMDPEIFADLSSFLADLENGNSLIVIQVNVFKCGGLAIGVRFHHKLTDTYTLSMFMSAWSMACRSSITQVIPPSFDFESLFPQKEIGESSFGKINTPPPSEINSQKLAFRNFTFRNDVISKLRAEITQKFNESNPDSTPFQASRIEVVSAVISKAIIEIKSAKSGVDSKPFVVYHTMSMRGKTNLHIAENSCGNFFTRVVTPPRKVEQTGMTTLSMWNMISDAIRKAKLQFSTATNVDLRSLVEERHKESAEAWGKAEDGEITLIRFSSWSKFPFYEVNFGWGKPDLVSSTVAPLELIILIDSKLNDGIEAWVTLGKDDMLLFKHKLETVLGL